MTTPSASSPNVTDLLIDLRENGKDAVDMLLPYVYDRLREIAHRQLLRERRGHTLSTTALVHEAYERLIDLDRVEWQDRAHFCRVAATAMRRILIDYARRRNAQKRGGGQPDLTLDDERLGASIDLQADTLLTLDEALSDLETKDPRMAQVVECRFFGGLTEKETAEALGVSGRTVRRDWARAKAWLYRALHTDSDVGTSS